MKYLRLVALFGIIFSYSSVSSAQDWDVTFVLSPSGSPDLIRLNDINNLGIISASSYERPSPDRLPIYMPILVSSGLASYLPYYGSFQRDTEASGINDNGVIVGYSSNEFEATQFATKWENQTISSLGSFGDYIITKAVDVNNSGIVIGEALDLNKTPDRVGWVYENGVFTALPLPQGYRYCTPKALNDSGVIIGMCDIDSFSTYSTGFAWHENLSASELGKYDARPEYWAIPYDINENGEIVGQALVPSQDHVYTFSPVYWANYSSNITLIRTPSRSIVGRKLKFDDASGSATSINDFGVVTGVVQYGVPGGAFSTIAYWYNKDTEPLYLSAMLQAKYGKELKEPAYYSKLNNCSQVLLTSIAFANPTGCLCGVNTQDLNNNKIIDCMEPTPASKPLPPLIRTKGSRVYVNFSAPPPGTGYKTVVQVYNSKNRRIGKKTTSGSQVEFKKLFGRTRKGQRLTVKANIYWTNGTITTQTSKRITKKFRVK